MRKLLALFLLLSAVVTQAATATNSRIRLTITVTNATVTGYSNVINASTRIFTNAQSSSTILTNLTSQSGAATNLWDNYSRFPIGSGITHKMTATNVVEFTAPIGDSLSGTVIGPWGYGILTTQAGPATITALWPMENMVGETNRTNQGSSLVYGLGIYSTNAFATNSTAISNALVKGASPLQTVVSPVNFWSIAGTNTGLTNGYIVSATLLSSIISNATIGGGTTITGSSVNLIGSGVNNFVSLTATSTVAAVGPIFYMARENGITNAVDASDVLGIIGFTGYGETGQKIGARIRAIPVETFTDLTAASILLFETTPTSATQPIGRLHIGSEGNVTVSNHFSALSITNPIVRGTNIINAQVVYTPTANSGLANGYNSAIALGATYVQFSGPSAAYTNVGFSAANVMNGKRHLCQFDNPGLSLTILHDSGLDSGDTNRIYTGTGALMNSTNNPAFLDIIYDTSVSRWRVISLR
jgi:hypothetical protein